MYAELINAISTKQDDLSKSPPAAAIFLPDGKPPRLGDIIRQPHLADAYKLIAEQGSDIFYHGKLGDHLVSHSHDLGGFFTHEDLADYRIIWKQPLSESYRGFQLCTQPPPSQGITLLMQAQILEHLDINSMPSDSSDLIHTMVEAKKLAFADRDNYVCDPDFHDVPIDNLLNRESAREQARRIGSQAANNVSPRKFTQSGEDTVYMTAVDAQGNAVVLIQSLYQAFGSCTMVPQSGMMLHNRGRGFSMDPSHPNRLEPRKRPYHTLHPVMVLKSGRPHLMLGTPGADGQTQTNIQLLTALIDFQAQVQGAVDAPRWRSQPDGSLWLENRFPEYTLRGLANRGHDVKEVDSFIADMGSAQAILIDRDRGVIMGGADCRRQAYGLCR
jgi:gamma-glutamyltranspeptidase/glutathione hydrolase